MVDPNDPAAAGQQPVDPAANMSTAPSTDANNSMSSAANAEQTRGVPVVSNIPGYTCTDFHGIHFELPARYETIKLIGKGTYGSVISARNRETGEQVAIKKLSHVEDLVSFHLSQLVNCAVYSSHNKND